jgi:DNA-binding MurR/RpiR family transcriptional regulator
MRKKLVNKIRALSKITRGQARIVDYLLKEDCKIAYESATSIAQKTGVSKSTVVRFIAKLGFKSFEEFQKQAQEEMENRLASPFQPYRLDEHRPSDSSHKMLKQNIANTLENLQKTYNHIKPEIFESICGMMVNDKGGLFFTGPRTSYGLAYMLWILTGYLRDRVHLLDNQGSSLPLQMINLTPDDQLFAIFRRPYSLQTINIAKYFAKVGANVILLTDSEINPLSKLTEWQLSIPFSEGPSVFGNFSVAVAVIESLVLAMERLCSDRAKERLNRVDGLFKIFSKFDYPFLRSGASGR